MRPSPDTLKNKNRSVQDSKKKKKWLTRAGKWLLGGDKFVSFMAQQAESSRLNHVIPSFSPLTSQPLASVLITPQLSHTRTRTHMLPHVKTHLHIHPHFQTQVCFQGTRASCILNYEVLKRDPEKDLQFLILLICSPSFEERLPFCRLKATRC